MTTTILFSAKDGTHGAELWLTDGTAGGTRLVKDIDPGSNGSYPLYLTSLGTGTAVFAANDGTDGKEVWVTDGTAAGTQLVKDINLGGAGSYPGAVMHGGFFALGNGRALFAADDGSAHYGTELWVTDGTTGGTHLLKDINPGTTDSNPSEFAALGNGKVLFQADDGTHGFELWITDGTTAGTQLVKDIYASFPNSYPSHITALGNGKAVFQASNGTNSVNGSTPFGNELWVTDGTAAGTQLLKDINPGRYSSIPGGIAVVRGMTALGNGKAVFLADDGTHGNELWVTDGTTAGTQPVQDIYPGPNSSVPYDFTVIANGEALFQAGDPTHGTELWITDGTAAGTQLVKDIHPGPTSSSPLRLTSLGNGKAVFAANDGSTGVELWVTDGTAAGTSLVSDIYPGELGSDPYFITPVGNGRAVFRANDGTHGTQLWITDGTAAGTNLVDDVFPSGDADPTNFVPLPQAQPSPAVLNNFGWAQGWGSPDNPRFTADVNGDGTSDYLGFGFSAVFVAYGGTFTGIAGQSGPGFADAVPAVQDFGTNEGYTAVVQRGAAATGAGVGDVLYGQGFAGIYWYAATSATAQTDASGNSYNVLNYQSSPNFYGNFGSQQGWSPANGFQILKSTGSDSFASILGFGSAGIVVGPQAFAPGATAAASYVIPLAAGNNFGWNQQNDIRTFTDGNGKTLDLNKDGIADFVGFGPQGLAFAFGNDNGPNGSYQLSPLQNAQINGSADDLGDAQGWSNSATLRYVVADPTTGFDDILAFGNAGVAVAMGQDPATHGGQAFGQLYLAMPDFGANQGWSVSQTPRLVGDVNGDGIPDIVGFGATSTFVAVGSRDSGGNLHFAINPNLTVGDFGFTEGWSGSNPQTVRTLTNFNIAGTSHSDLVLSGAFNTQVWQFA